MEDGRELYAMLSQHTGSQEFYRHALVRSFLYTEGVQDFAQHAGNGAYWLLDILATEPAITKLVSAEGFGVVVLDVVDTKATLSVAGDSGIPPVFKQELNYTDCPTGQWKFFLAQTEMSGKVVIMCMLPGEY